VSEPPVLGLWKTGSDPRSDERKPGRPDESQEQEPERV
jgi:hypothetical protein